MERYLQFSWTVCEESVRVHLQVCLWLFSLEFPSDETPNCSNLSGNWLNVNGEAIYSTRPWEACQNETDSSVFYTKKVDRLYAHFTKWPEGNALTLNCPIATENTQVYFLGLDAATTGRVGWSGASNRAVHATSRRTLQMDSGILVNLPALTPDIIPCEHAWVLVLTGLANL